MRQQTQQPDQYLREVLQSIAASITEGEYRGLWELKGSFKTAGDPADREGADGTASRGEDGAEPKSEVGADEDDGEDDDDEDFDDFEEVME